MTTETQERLSNSPYNRLYMNTHNGSFQQSDIPVCIVIETVLLYVSESTCTIRPSNIRPLPCIALTKCIGPFVRRTNRRTTSFPWIT